MAGYGKPSMGDGTVIMQHVDEEGEITIRQSWDGKYIFLKIRERDQEPATVCMPSAWLYAIWDDGARKRQFCDVLDRLEAQRLATVKPMALGRTMPELQATPHRRLPNPEEEWTPEQIAAAEAILEQLLEDPISDAAQPAGVLEELLKERYPDEDEKDDS